MQNILCTFRSYAHQEHAQGALALCPRYVRRKVLALSTAGSGKDVVVDRGVVKRTDATIVHSDLMEEHIWRL